MQLPFSNSCSERNELLDIYPRDHSTCFHHSKYQFPFPCSPGRHLYYWFFSLLNDHIWQKNNQSPHRYSRFHHSYSQPLHSAPQQPTPGSFLQFRIAANYMVVRTPNVNFEPWFNNQLKSEYRIYQSSKKITRVHHVPLMKPEYFQVAGMESINHWFLVSLAWD